MRIRGMDVSEGEFSGNSKTTNSFAFRDFDV